MSSGDSQPLDARAHTLGAQLDLRGLERAFVCRSTEPLVLAVGEHGQAVPFRFGVVVCFGLDLEAERAWLAQLRPYVRQAIEPEMGEDVDVVVVSDAPERVAAEGIVQLSEATPERLAVVAEVLAKSALLAHHEHAVEEAFDHVELLAEQLQGRRWTGASRDVLAEIGRSLAVQVRMVGRAEVGDKPDLIWDDPGLDRLYERLATEFELDERETALNRKLQLVASAGQTYVELLHSRHGLRLEWAIVWLIVFEIVLILWDMLGGGGHA